MGGRDNQVQGVGEEEVSFKREGKLLCSGQIKRLRIPSDKKKSYTYTKGRGKSVEGR